ncbi:11498_t:CDS:2 [Funneliformis mosseae]|uniref:11498_t:CDS:1 n=1 Tax=Funneliformis mosseae TaxID=27381 RepID=A0A9N8ZMM6_FUNMO|nr:11498_t:CDS:2 [Funneliformis mosseae]
MGISMENTKRNLPLGIELLPGETVEILETTTSIKLFEATVEGGFTECGDVGIGELYNLTDIINESTMLVTNYRICYQPMKNLSKSLYSSTSSMSSIVETSHPRTVQIPHLSIAQIDESQKNQIIISLKLSPLKYLIKFSKPKPKPKPSNNNGNGLIHNRANANSLCHDFSFILKKFIRPNSIEKLFGGISSEEEVDDDFLRRGLDKNVYRRYHKLGWSNGYKIQKEFGRMQMSKDSWSIASYNDDFSLSPTYPKDFILPSRILKKDAIFACESFDTSAKSDSYEISTALQSSPEFFQKLVKFRKNGRFPIICWKRGHHVLMRSGQPMVSILGWRGIEDELLIKEVLKAVNEEQQQHIVNISKYYSSKISNGKYDKFPHKKYNGLQEKCTNTKICILDARSYSAAFSNGLACGGYEKCENYPPNTTLQFLGLSNIHAISASHSSLLSAIATHASSSKWFSVLESTGWLGHVADLLKAAGGKDGVVGKIVDEDASVLVHCTDGWDRTTQLVSLSQIMLDPFYRTIKGFQVLIEKEWIAHGHPFRARGDLPTNIRNDDSLITPREEEQSSTRPNCQQPLAVQSAPAPVFLLFLTCLHHLLQQFPSSFEYNDFLLLCLARAAAGNSPYGDFLCNSECEREYVRLRERTKSIWSWVREHKQWFRNPRYDQNTKYDNQNNIGVWFDDKWKKEVLRPDTGARFITLWNEYYFPKDNFSITLLSIPPGYEIPFPTGLVATSRSCHSSEYALIKLLMKSKERRIAEKVWKIWRSFVLEKKNNQLLSIKKLDGDDDINNVENDEMEVELMGASVWHDSNIVVTDKKDISKQSKENSIIDDNAESKFLLVMSPEKSKIHDNHHKNYFNVPSPTYLSPSLSELLPAKEDYFSEEEEPKPVYPANKGEEERSSSSPQQWVYLCRQNQKLDDSKDSSQTLAELLKEAQLDDHYLCQSKCRDSKIIVDLLSEAQLDNDSLLPKQRNISASSNPLLSKQRNTSASNNSLSSKQRNMPTSNISLSSRQRHMTNIDDNSLSPKQRNVSTNDNNSLPKQREMSTNKGISPTSPSRNCRNSIRTNHFTEPNCDLISNEINSNIGLNSVENDLTEFVLV